MKPRSQHFSHVAVTVPPAQLEGTARAELLEFYGEVFGWSESPRFAIPRRRILLRAPGDDQYLTLRGSDEPMRTSGYEHLGVRVDSKEELQAIHARAGALRSRFPDVELEPIRIEYNGALVTFRVRFRLPLTFEVQHLRVDA